MLYIYLLKTMCWTILYVHTYLWIGQYLYYEYMVYTVNLYLVLLSIIKIGHANFLSFLIIFLIFSSFFCSVATTMDKPTKPASNPE
jgi:uncharacterized membrane-anchored protein YitT (DUF2179 family)